ncbi:MAG: hypothetical protein A2Y17_04085 [Clostridiales bacterium GWF2_38_85]|nr:MAG: hypothetical protein A2Y17_04085 [Clostridiales bacterium GWF2_38_85]HBL83467.1 pseudouridine synthase [Clostridiales bacterium]
MAEERIQKYLAAAGICSRREADAAVSEGKVKVNNKTAVIGQKVIEDDIIEFRGEVVGEKERKVYYMLNKPAGYVTTMDDSHAEKCVADLFGGIEFRVYPVGRLDRASQGLLILTNDGELALRLTHPRYHVEKVYIVTVKGEITSYMLNHLMAIDKIEGEKIKPVKVTIEYRNSKSTTLKFILNEGRNRQIRKMCAMVKLEISELKRVAIGDLKLGNLQPGAIRKLTKDEVNYLKGRVGSNA